MVKKPTLFAVLYFCLSSFAWSFDGVAYAYDRINLLIWIAGPILVVILIIGAIMDLVPRSGKPRYRGYTGTPARPSQTVQPSYQPSYRPNKGVNYVARGPSPYWAWTSLVLFHGTPKMENAADIAGSGFIIGERNSYGNGLYLTADFWLAKSFAAGTGAILKVKLEAPSDQIADLNSVTNSAGYRNWCSSLGNGNQADDITNYTLTVLRRRYIKVTNQNIYVALANPTFVNERVVFEGLTVLSVLDPKGNQIM